MEAYKRWVRMNKDYVHSLESLANGMTWLLPERFSSSEIGPEAVTAILGVVTAINEHIIETTPNQMHRGPPVGPSQFPYPLCISALKDLETLVEVAAEQYYGDTKKWNFIAASEAIKVLVRLALFRNSGYRMLLHGGEELNVVKESDPSNTPLRGSFNQHGLNLEGKAVTALSKFGENARMMAVEPPWLRRVQHQNSSMNSPTLVVEKPTLSSILSQRGFRGVLFLLGETLFITRPLIYVLLIRKYGTQSWTPWFVSLVVDFLGVGIFSPALFSGRDIKDKQFLPTDSEKDEMKRRKVLWALYLMRDPFFTKYTRRRFEAVETTLEPVPLIGTLTAKVIELIVGAQTRYTYMSGS